MKKCLVMLGLLLGLASVSHAGTPQENYYNGQAPLSGLTILASSATTVGTATLVLTVSTPTVVNSGGGTFTGRNCFTKFVVQIATTSVLTIADNLTTKWTIYGTAIGTTGTNTLVLPEDHLGPWCTAAGDQTVFTITPTAGNAGNPEAIDVEGFTTYGGTINSGPMY
jgi:hypothetical protein